MHPEACPVVALVCKAIDDVQVVVDALVVGGEECASRFWVTQVSEVNDVCDWATRRSGPLAITLVKLVVE